MKWRVGCVGFFRMLLDCNLYGEMVGAMEREINGE